MFLQRIELTTTRSLLRHARPEPSARGVVLYRRRYTSKWVRMGVKILLTTTSFRKEDEIYYFTADFWIKIYFLPLYLYLHKNGFLVV